MCKSGGMRDRDIGHLLGADAPREPRAESGARGSRPGLPPAIGTKGDHQRPGQAEMVSCDDAISSGLVL
jgi:hypothetical protein